MSLTETAFYTRRAINWGILGIVGYILLPYILEHIPERVLFYFSAAGTSP